MGEPLVAPVHTCSKKGCGRPPEKTNLRCHEEFMTASPSASFRLAKQTPDRRLGIKVSVPFNVDVLCLSADSYASNRTARERTVVIQYSQLSVMCAYNAP